MDQIRIENLEIYAYHGVFPEENKKGQPFFVNVIMDTDTREAGQKDDLSLSTHYGEVCHMIHERMTKKVYKLLEAVAEELAIEILLHFPRIQKVELELRKPEAPIGLPFESVSVRIQRQWHRAYIALGSNLGDRNKHVETAIDKIKNHNLCRNSRISQMVSSLPYGGVEQEIFLNGVLEVETIMNPKGLLAMLQQTEKEEERTREIHWGPRTLDLDILFFDQMIIDSAELTIPHKDMQNRDFVLQPLAEIAPFLRHPLTGKTIVTMLEELKIKQDNYVIDKI